MDILKILLVFGVIMLVMRQNKPLYVSMFFGSVATAILFKISFADIYDALKIGLIGKTTIVLVLAFYSITFLQRMLEKRELLMLAEESLTNIFNSRRINAMIAPFVIGLLPSAGAILIAAPIVDNAAGDYLDVEERTFVTSFYRHISEAFLPTYASILLALQLSGVDMTAFVFAMLPVVFVLFYLGYIFYIRKIPKSKEPNKKTDKKQEVMNLIKSLWTIFVTIIIILAFKLPVHYAVAPIIVLAFFAYKFTFEEIKPMFKSAFEVRLIATTIMVMIFKELLTKSGVIETLPGYFSVLPVPPVVVFGLIFFFGSLVAGSQGMIALALPLAFATVPNAGLALLIFLMSMTYIAMQVSPMHICLAIITEENNVSFLSLVKKTMPVLIVFIIIISAYSYGLSLIF